MVRPLYSRLFYSANPAPIGGTVIGGPPSGFVWDVRNIVVVNAGLWFNTASAFSVADSHGTYLAQVEAPDSYNGRLYSFDIRQLIEPPDFLQISAGDDAWSVRISGYQLTAI